MQRIYFFLTVYILALFACNKNLEHSDAYGNFETTEVLVSAEANGRIMELNVDEGDSIKAGDLLGYVDTIMLYLKKKQLQASLSAVNSKTQSSQPQIDVLEEKKRNLLREKSRIEALVLEKAATPKQLDDISGEIDVVEKQIIATKRQIKDLNQGILGEIDPIKVQIDQINEQLKKSYIRNPIDGIVLLKFAESSEMTASGKPLYKIANMNQMILRVYVSGSQLPHIGTGQKVQVLIDENENQNTSLEGTISWISDKAEFTPKIVQTKEERVNLVYAVKVMVENNGQLKIGMPGEVNFSTQPLIESEAK